MDARISCPSSSETVTKALTVVESRKSFFDLDLTAIWQYRELLYFLVWRDVKVRYKQTIMGAAWAIFQPLITIVIFAIIFGNFVGIPSDGLPYPIFVYAALLPWNYFAQALARSGTSLVGNANLITKVYFPRLIIPISAAVAPVVDFLFSLFFLLILIGWYGITPTWGVVALPFFFLLALMTAIAVGLWLAPLNVRYRDVGHMIPFLGQIWMYASPVVYPVGLIPEKWRLAFGLNPMTGVIEGFRWGLLGKQGPDFTMMAYSTGAVIILLLSGLVFFRRMERTFADVV